MDLSLIIASALFGGAVSAVGVTALNQYQKTRKLRLLKAAGKAVSEVASMSGDAEAAEVEKRAVDEKYAKPQLQDAVAKL